MKPFVGKLAHWLQGRVGHTAVAVCLALAATFFTPWMLRTTDTLFYTNSVFALVLFTLYMGLFYSAPRFATTRRFCTTAPLALVFSACMVLGAAVDTRGDVAFGNPLVYLAVLANAPLFCALLMLLWHRLDNRRPGPTGARLARLGAGLGGWIWPLCWLFLLLCWLPVLLAAWPGFFTYDAMAQYQQYTTGAITGHHPPLHTLLLGFGVTSLAGLFGSTNAGIAAYLFLQMMVVAACFVRAIHFLHQLGQPLWLRALALCYYGLFPTVAMFAACSSKDTLFSALVLLFLIELWQALRSGRAFYTSPLRVARFVAVTFLMLCLRNNAPWALLAALPFVALRAEKPRWRMATMAGVPLLLFALYSGPLLGALGVAPGNSRELLSVPMQQLARVHQRAPQRFSPKELADLYALIPEENLRLYHPKLADPVKQGFQSEVLRADPQRYLGLWLGTGLKNPSLYVNSFLENTVDSWYPDSLVNGYNFPGLRERVFAVGGTSYFYALIEPPAQPDSKLPALLAFYETLSYQISYHKIPLVSLLFSPAFMVWVLLLCLAWLRYRGAKRAGAPLLFLLFLFFTCLLGPIVQVRYLLYVYFALPLMAGLLLRPEAY